MEREKAEREESLEREIIQQDREKGEREEKLARERIQKDNTATPQVNLPMFKEDQDKFDAYINRFENYAILRNWPKSDWPVQLSMLLTGQALDTFYGLSKEQQKVYKEVKDALMRRCSMTEEGFRKELFKTRVKQEKTLNQLMARLEQLFDS